MTSLIADEAVLAVLRQAKELAEVRDASGNVVGFFAPVALPYASSYASVAAQIDQAELQRRKQANAKGYTTREVFERLRSLTQDERMRAYLQEKIERLQQREQCAAP
jgi:hypothetical protein